LLPSSFAATRVGVGLETDGEPEAEVGRFFFLQVFDLAGGGEAWGVPIGEDAELVGTDEFEEEGGEGEP
jgi:hypothetical protein